MIVAVLDTVKRVEGTGLVRGEGEVVRVEGTVLVRGEGQVVRVEGTGLVRGEGEVVRRIAGRLHRWGVRVAILLMWSSAYWA